MSVHVIDADAEQLSLATVAELLGGIVHQLDRLTRYEFLRLAAAITFSEIVDGRATRDMYRTTHPVFAGTWAVYVADNTVTRQEERP